MRPVDALLLSPSLSLCLSSTGRALHATSISSHFRSAQYRNPALHLLPSEACGAKTAIIAMSFAIKRMPASICRVRCGESLLTAASDFPLVADERRQSSITGEPHQVRPRIPPANIRSFLTINPLQTYLFTAQNLEQSPIVAQVREGLCTICRECPY